MEQLTHANLGVRLGVSESGLDQLFVHYRLRKATDVKHPVDAATVNLGCYRLTIK
jgi:hypothetical protein